MAGLLWRLLFYPTVFNPIVFSQSSVGFFPPQQPLVSYYQPPPTTPTNVFSQPDLSWDYSPLPDLFPTVDEAMELSYGTSVASTSDDIQIDEEEIRKWLSFSDQSHSAVHPQNRYKWAVKPKDSFVVSDSNVKDILESFGTPTTDVAKMYDDLAQRVGYDITHGGLTQGTIGDLESFFDATYPLHFQFNDYLRKTWTGNLNAYSGSKKEIPLYGAMRSELTKGLKTVSLTNRSLNEVLTAVSGRPAEVHHLLYKAKRPSLANNVGNLVLSQRSESEKRSGPGQHELMHMVSSGKHSDKFNVLLDAFESRYKDYMKRKGILL